MGQKLKKLFIITQHYPYGNGEKSFIEPELQVLLDNGQFDITIICNARTQMGMVNKVDSRANVINIPLRPIYMNPLGLIRGVCKFLLDKRCKGELFEVVKSKGNLIRKMGDSLYYFIQAEQFYKEVCKQQIDLNDSIVYTYWFNTQALAVSLYKDNWQGISFVSRIHGFDLYNERTAGGRQPFRKLMDQKVDALFFIAESGVEYYKKHFFVSSSDKYFVRRLGTLCREEYADIVRQQKKCEQFCMVSCSNLIPLKRVEYIIRALHGISDVEIEWIHFGDGMEKDILEKMAEQLLGNKINVKFEFKGVVENCEIKEFYLKNKVDCFITTSSTEGCPVSIQEALSYGIPVIATTVGEIPLMIQGNGILLRQDPEICEVTAAIRKMHDMREEDKEQMRIVSRKLWEQYFDANKNFGKFAESLLEI